MGSNEKASDMIDLHEHWSAFLPKRHSGALRPPSLIDCPLSEFEGNRFILCMMRTHHDCSKTVYESLHHYLHLHVPLKTISMAGHSSR